MRSRRVQPVTDAPGAHPGGVRRPPVRALPLPTERTEEVDLHRMMQLAHGMVGLRRRGVAAVVLAAGLLGMAAPVFAQVTAPGAPVGLVAVAGDLKVTLNWKEPDSDGGAPITGYEYRYKSMGNSYPAGWTAVPDDALGVGASLGAYLIQPNLMNGTAYTFQVRAVNSEGGGTPSDEATATPPTQHPRHVRILFHQARPPRAGDVGHGARHISGHGRPVHRQRPRRTLHLPMAVDQGDGRQ